MSTHSKFGREWAKLSELKPGAIVEMDGDFTCGIANRTLVVGKDADGFFVNCDHGRHGLEPNASDVDGDHLVGIWPVKN